MENVDIQNADVKVQGTTNDALAALKIPVDPVYFSAAHEMVSGAALVTRAGSGMSRPSTDQRRAYDAVIGAVEF
jgi:hypothetical protein